VQLQLIPSGGMTIQAQQIVAAPGGFVFNVDGIGDRPGGAHSHLVQVPAFPQVLQVLPPTIPPIGALQVRVPSDIPIGTYYNAGAGEVHCYPPLPLIPARPMI
jgi:hypothetical protein